MYKPFVFEYAIVALFFLRTYYSDFVNLKLIRRDFCLKMEFVLRLWKLWKDCNGSSYEGPTSLTWEKQKISTWGSRKI